MRPKYSLTISANDQGDWSRCRMSTHMIARGLVEAFTELEDVDLVGVIDPHKDPLGTTVPACDVLLVHDYFASLEKEFRFDVGAMVKRVKCIALFLELGAVNADISFTYQRTLCKRTGYAVIIPAPIVLKHVRILPKKPRTILLDHDYPLGGWPEGMDAFVREGAGNCRDLYRILEQFKDQFTFYQMERFPEGRKWKPPWVKIIPQMSYPEYMAATAEMDWFIVTHAGSYNHTVVDMAARGTRVFTVHGNISNELADSMGVTVLGHVSDYVRMLRTYHQLSAGMPKIANCTPMPKVARIMDGEFRKFLNLES